jgi:hypothetical protein
VLGDRVERGDAAVGLGDEVDPGWAEAARTIPAR